MRQKIYDLLSEVKKIEQISAKAAKASHSSANEASGGLGASYSAAGDAEHARNSANLSMQKYSAIKKLSEELQKSLDREVPEKVAAACYVLVKYSDGSEKQLYFVENPVYVSGYNLISHDSPLGKSLSGKKVGESFSYTSGEQKYEGEIVSIG